MFVGVPTANAAGIGCYTTGGGTTVFVLLFCFWKIENCVQ